MVAGSVNSAPELTEMNQEAGMPRMRRTSARRPWRPLQTGQWGSKRTPELLLCGLGARGNVCQSPLVLKKIKSHVFNLHSPNSIPNILDCRGHILSAATISASDPYYHSICISSSQPHFPNPKPRTYHFSLRSRLLPELIHQTSKTSVNETLNAACAPLLLLYLVFCR